LRGHGGSSFKWDKSGDVSPALIGFAPDRYTVKVISDDERVITRMVGDTAGKARSYKCHAAGYPDGRIAFDDGYGIDTQFY
jgi:hypothetical protein